LLISIKHILQNCRTVHEAEELSLTLFRCFVFAISSLIIILSKAILVCLLMPMIGYLGLLTRHVMCKEFSQCYDDVNICLWTDDSTSLTQSAAQSACQQRSNSSLPRITNSNIQSKLRQFRSAGGNFGGGGFWIDVKGDGNNNWHWIDGSSLAGQLVS